jgi:hypothetical protein
MQALLRKRLKGYISAVEISQHQLIEILVLTETKQHTVEVD